MSERSINASTLLFDWSKSVTQALHPLWSSASLESIDRLRVGDSEGSTECPEFVLTDR